MRSTQRFSDRVANYIKYRPGYPEEVIGILNEEAGFDSEWIVADIGSGTGISSRLFLSNGNQVFAVEPNDAMRSAAQNLLSLYPGFKSVDGTESDTHLPDHSIDLIVVAQAFHWFDRKAALAEFRRIITPRGKVLLMWNERLVNKSPFLQNYEKLLLRFSTDYEKVNHANMDEQVFVDFFHNGKYKLFTLENLQRLDFEGLEGRLLSSSYVPNVGEPGYEEMLTVLRELFDRLKVDGYVTIEYLTKGYIGVVSRKS